MASILDILIEILKIDCGIAQCYYANEIEAMFYLFFFPTIFIILFIYILTNFIFRGGGGIKGIRLLIAVGAYAFIVFEGWFTLVVSVSHLWWILTIILVGLFAFVRFLFKGGGEGGGGHMPGLAGSFREYLSERARDVISDERSDLKKEIEDRIKTMEGVVDNIKNPPSGTDVGILIGKYWNIRQQTEELITKYSKKGKVGIADVEKLGDPYWKKLDELTDKFKKAERRVKGN